MTPKICPDCGKEFLGTIENCADCESKLTKMTLETAKEPVIEGERSENTGIQTRKKLIILALLAIAVVSIWMIRDYTLYKDRVKFSSEVAMAESLKGTWAAYYYFSGYSSPMVIDGNKITRHYNNGTTTTHTVTYKPKKGEIVISESINWYYAVIEKDGKIYIDTQPKEKDKTFYRLYEKIR